MRLTVYKELSELLRSIEGLKWVDWDFGQLAMPQKDYPVPLPAALISFGDFTFDDLPDRVQEGEVTIYIDLYLRRAGDLQATSPKQAETLQQLELLDAISSRLHASWQSECIQALHRRGEGPISTTPDLIGVRQSYEARMIDTHMQGARDLRKVRLAPTTLNTTKTKS